ncbi:MAG TPA: hypothetical protein VIH54_05420 [Chthoniobacterales bacterium]
MLIVPTLVPEPVVTGVEAAGVAAAADGAGEVAALLVWASAEIAKKTATARESRKNLLVIGSLNSLEPGSGNELSMSSLEILFSQRWAASDKAQLDSQRHTPRLQGWHPSLT